MPLPLHCIECDKPVDENDYSDVMCSKCIEGYFEPTSADDVNKEEKIDPPKRQLNNLSLAYISLQDHWFVRLGFKLGLIKRRTHKWK